MDKAFNSVHGAGAQLRDEQMKEPIETTAKMIKKMCPDINIKVINVFTSTKYHARVRSLNEDPLIPKRKSTDTSHFSKRIKTMRDFTKDGHYIQIHFLKIDISFITRLLMCVSVSDCSGPQVDQSDYH